jgi:hypothetical protein
MEAVGDALTSECQEYVISGAACLCVIAITWILVIAIVIKGIMENRTSYKRTQATGDVSGRLKEAFAKIEDQQLGWFASKKAKYEAFSQIMKSLKERGEWTDADEGGSQVCGQ